MAEAQTSGAPDNAPIWDENNELVNEEMLANAIEYSEAVMQPVAYAAEFYQNLDSPKEVQAQEGMTPDVMTSPEPTSDPNHMPTPFTIPEPPELPEGVVVEQQSSGGGGSPSAPAPQSVPSPPAPVSGDDGTDD